MKETEVFHNIFRQVCFVCKYFCNKRANVKKRMKKINTFYNSGWGNRKEFILWEFLFFLKDASVDLILND